MIRPHCTLIIFPVVIVFAFNLWYRTYSTYRTVFHAFYFTLSHYLIEDYMPCNLHVYMKHKVCCVMVDARCVFVCSSLSKVATSMRNSFSQNHKIQLELTEQMSRDVGHLKHIHGQTKPTNRKNNTDFCSLQLVSKVQQKNISLKNCLQQVI